VAETCTGTSTVCPADLTALRSTQKLRKIRLRPRERALESIRFRRRCRGARQWSLRGLTSLTSPATRRLALQSGRRWT
jgi:hypothetical protein